MYIYIYVYIDLPMMMDERTVLRPNLSTAIWPKNDGEEKSFIAVNRATWSSTPAILTAPSR